MYILGINETHNASAALLKNGEIVAAAQEERFTRIKGQGGFPKHAISFCLNQQNISMDELDFIVFGPSNPLRSFTNTTESFMSNLLFTIFRSIPFVFWVYQYLPSTFYRLFSPLVKMYHYLRLSRKLNVSSKKLLFCDHHTAHAYSAYYMTEKKSPSIVITNDGGGGGKSGAVFSVDKDEWTQIAFTPETSSLGAVYYDVTRLLGFTPDQDEHKIMGLSAYTKVQGFDDIYAIFKNLIWSKKLSFNSIIPTSFFYAYLQKNLIHKRFDKVSGFLQHFIETLLVEQAIKTVEKTGVTNIVYGGGLALNIKANMRVAELPKIKFLSVGPSSGDESNAVGHCFWGYQNVCQQKKLNFKPERVNNLYLGPAFSNKQIQKALEKEFAKKNKSFQIVKLDQKNKAKTVATLLAKGEIIARFSERMEFGARALGNRSILADPRKTEVVKIINDKIKSRDFWMPFAPVILSARANEYIVNPKHIDSPCMTIAFQTTEKARKEIPAVLHPADFTTRPQLLKETDNPSYYEIIVEFEKLTNIPVLLNTSFNLHGQPIVCTPLDALKTFKQSGLMYLLLEDYLICKKTND